jgi:diacylglycerol kinase family enzyme
LTSLPIVLNPIAGGGRLLRSRPTLDAVAHACGVELEWLATEERGHGEELARRAAADGCPLVLAYGGDGTYNEVARGIRGTQTSMGVLPGGTTSVLAYELDIPRPAARALRALLDGVDRPMRVGESDRGDLILLMLSAGPDAVVVQDLPEKAKRRGGKRAIAVQAIKELLSRRRLPSLRVITNGTGVDAGWVIVGNARSYGGPFHATPGANPFDIGFETVIQCRVGRRAALPFACAIVFGRHVDRSDVVRLNEGRVRLEACSSDPVPYQVDGDAVGVLPVEVWTAEQTVMVRLPKDSLWVRDGRG